MSVTIQQQRVCSYLTHNRFVCFDYRLQVFLNHGVLVF
jgi:hypothetical protein